MRRLAIASTICIFAYLASPYFLTSARWSGQFTLRVELDVPPDVDRDSFAYYECWNDNLAHWLCESEAGGHDEFKPAFRSMTDADFVSVSSRGTSNAFGIFDTYHHPSSLVLQHRRTTADGTSRWHRVRIPIPPGRGDRETSLDFSQADVEQKIAREIAN